MSRRKRLVAGPRHEPPTTLFRTRSPVAERGYKTGTPARARAGTRVHCVSCGTGRFPARTRPRVPASGRACPTRPSLVMKGSAVRVRASALPNLQAVCPRDRVGWWCSRVQSGYEAGTRGSHGPAHASDLVLRRVAPRPRAPRYRLRLTGGEVPSHGAPCTRLTSCLSGRRVATATRSRSASRALTPAVTRTIIIDAGLENGHARRST